MDPVSAKEKYDKKNIYYSKYKQCIHIIYEEQ